MVDWSIILYANNHKTGNGTGMGRRTVTREQENNNEIPPEINEIK